MIRTLSSNEVKQRWGAVMGSVSRGEGEVIVESHGKPKVAVVSYEEFEALRAMREKRDRDEILRQFRELSDRLAGKNDDLTPEQVDELANRFSHEFFEELVQEGKIRYEPDVTEQAPHNR